MKKLPSFKNAEEQNSGWSSGNRKGVNLLNEHREKQAPSEMETEENG